MKTWKDLQEQEARDAANPNKKGGSSQSTRAYR